MRISPFTVTFLPLPLVPIVPTFEAVLAPSTPFSIITLNTKKEVINTYTSYTYMYVYLTIYSYISSSSSRSHCSNFQGSASTIYTILYNNIEYKDRSYQHIYKLHIHVCVSHHSKLHFFLFLLFPLFQLSRQC